MQNKFWFDRWQNNAIGWHRENVHPLLLKLGADFFKEPQQIFVPLCGKSKDMVWLADKGHQIIGLELSSLAIAAFFEEQNLIPKKIKMEKFILWTSGAYQILEGDIFDLNQTFFKKEFEGCKSWYDRAAMVALPENIREKYVALMMEVFSQGQGLLISLRHNSGSRQGPPFSLDFDAVKKLWKGARSLKSICSLEPQSVTDQELVTGKKTHKSASVVSTPSAETPKLTELTEQAYEIYL